ncbi:hypothetical protein V7201_10715 [Bacillus sp. JJ1122]|uniref:hypothetical protein n=1 Tax=Bacillus sp. JJ1122 TaxID=3122951 RepID=UPI0030007BA5
MNITIDLYLIANDTNFSQRGSFPVRVTPFKQDPHKEAARVAGEWLRRIRRDMTYPVGIRRVVYNGDQDITELFNE